MLYRRFARLCFLGVSEVSAIAKSTCRLKMSTRATKTDNWSPTLNRLRERLPMSCRRLVQTNKNRPLVRRHE